MASTRSEMRADLARCLALKASINGCPADAREEDLLREFGYLDKAGYKGLSAAGWEAAGDAIGFQEGDQ